MAEPGLDTNHVLAKLTEVCPLFRPEKVIGVGAEAVLTKGVWAESYFAVAKYRIEKPYRHESLDKTLRRKRTAMEAKLMAAAKAVGVPCPSVIYLDVDNGILIMDYIPGQRLRDIMDKLDSLTLGNIFRLVGKYLGLMHRQGVIHGDLTTSNIIVVNAKKPVEIYIIDFGLGEFSREWERMGVDAHLLLRAIESTHPSVVSRAFSAFLEGYGEVRGEEAAREIISRVKSLRQRGRYVESRRKKKFKSTPSLKSSRDRCYEEE